MMYNSLCNNVLMLNCEKAELTIKLIWLHKCLILQYGYNRSLCVAYQAWSPSVYILASFFVLSFSGRRRKERPVSSHLDWTCLANNSLFQALDSGADAKVKGTRNVGGAGKRKKATLSHPIFLSFFSCSRFLNSADPTMSEPGKG